jgi:hypothetical protein
VKILYPTDYLPTSNPAQTRLIEKFVSGLESALHTQRTMVSLAELWSKDLPDGEAHENVAEYLDTVCSYITFWMELGPDNT